MSRLLKSRLFRFLPLSVLVLAGCIPTVDYVDVERYMGTWYQISANPQFFNEGLVGVTATYTLRDDGVVDVVNAGFIGDFDGPIDRIEGEARVLNEETNASLSVDFVGSPLLQKIPSYNIVVLGDADDYGYAAVTDPAYSSLFILSRTPQMDPALYHDILDDLAEQGIPLDRLELTPQPGA